MPPQYLICAGVGRSGTTAMRKSLGLHPQIYYPGSENNLLSEVLDTALRNCTIPDRQVGMLVSQERYDHAFHELFDSLLWSDRAEHPSQIRMASCDLASNVTDYLYQVLPSTKMLYMIRDGIHVVASRVLFDAFKIFSFEEHCDIWLRAPQIYAWGVDKPDRVRFFRYEWLYDEARARAELAALFDWMEIPWHDAPFQNLLTQHYHSTQHPNQPVLAETNQGVVSKDERATFQQTRSERWMYWTQAERAMFEERCGDAMHELGYELPWVSDSSIPATDIAAKNSRWLESVQRKLKV